MTRKQTAKRITATDAIKMFGGEQNLARAVEYFLFGAGVFGTEKQPGTIRYDIQLWILDKLARKPTSRRKK